MQAGTDRGRVSGQEHGKLKAGPPTEVGGPASIPITRRSALAAAEAALAETAAATAAAATAAAATAATKATAAEATGSAAAGGTAAGPRSGSALRSGRAGPPDRPPLRSGCRSGAGRPRTAAHGRGRRGPMPARRSGRAGTPPENGVIHGPHHRHRSTGDIPPPVPVIAHTVQ